MARSSIPSCGRSAASRKRSGDGGAGVDDLMAADEARQRQVEQQLLQLHDETAALLVGVELLAPHDQRRAEPQRLGADDVLGLRLLLRNNGRHAARRMPAFSAAIFGSVAPSFSAWSSEIGVMTSSTGRSTTLVASRRPPRPTSSSSTSAGLLGEGKEGGRRGDLELGDVVAAVGGLRARQHIDQRLLADRRRLAARAGKLDALVEAHEMRRRIDVHARAGGFEDRLQVGGDRALAVGAGDVHDRRQLRVRIAQLAEQPLDTAERQVDQLRMQQLHLGEELGARRHAALPPLGSVRTGAAGASDRRPPIEDRAGDRDGTDGGHQCCLSLGSERVVGGVSSSLRGLSRVLVARRLEALLGARGSPPRSSGRSRCACRSAWHRPRLPLA